MRNIILFLILFFAVTALAEMTTPPKSTEQAYLPTKNLLINPDAELGKAGVTASSAATFTITTTQANVRNGKQAFKFDPSSSGQTITFSNNPNWGNVSGLYGLQNGAASCAIKAEAVSTLTQTLEAYDGSNVLATTTISANTSAYQRNTINFAYPSSGTVSLRIKSNSASDDAIFVDDCYIGLAEGYNISQVSQAEMYGYLKYAGNASCDWTTGNTGGADTEFGADTDCAAASVEGYASAPATKVPRIKFSSLPPGKYEVVIQMHAVNETGSTTANHFYKIYDGTTKSGTTQLTTTASTNTAPRSNTMIGYFTYTTSQTNIEFRPVAQSNSDSNDPFMSNNASNMNFEIWVKRFPLSSQTSFKPDEIAWRVDANISGANPSLGTSAQTTYLDISNASLTLTQNSGSISTGIACDAPGTETQEVGDTTCTGSEGNESIGITTTIPRAGAVQACVTFAYATQAAASNGNVTFQVMECDNNSASAANCREGNTRLWVGPVASTNELAASPRVCGNFQLASSGQKTFRLMREMSAFGTAPVLVGDAASTIGQRDIHWEVYPINQQSPAPLLVNSVVSPSSGIENVTRAVLQNGSSTTCAATTQSGSWLTTPGTRNGTGDCTFTFVAGTFSAAPTCTCMSDGTATTECVGAITSTTIRVTTLLNNVAADESGVSLICMGPK